MHIMYQEENFMTYPLENTTHSSSILYGRTSIKTKKNIELLIIRYIYLHGENRRTFILRQGTIYAIVSEKLDQEERIT